jgi:hypothetical protein
MVEKSKVLCGSPMVFEEGFQSRKKYGKSSPAFADEARASDAIVINIQENLDWVQVENFKEGQQGSAIYQSWN